MVPGGVSTLSFPENLPSAGFPLGKGAWLGPGAHHGFLLCSPRLEEEEHFRVLVRMAAQELSNGVPDSGHLYASIRAGRTLAPAGDLQETFGGMDQVRLLRLAGSPGLLTDWPP